MNRNSSPLRRAVLAAAVACVLGTTACSSTGADATGSTAGGSSAGGTAPAAATAAVQAAVKGIDGPVPTTGPSAVQGRNVWIVSAFEQVPNIAVMTKSLKEAGQALGWKVSVCDGRNNAGGAWAACVRQAVAAKASGIILDAVDCAPVKAALAEARSAGTKIVGMSAFDCSDPRQGGGASMFDGNATFVSTVPSTAEFLRQQGRLRADWIIAQSKGRAKVVHVRFRGVALGEYLAEGFTEEIATCKGCSVVGTVDITPEDIPQIRQKFESALLKAPQADAVAVDEDFIVTAGIQQALATANRPGLIAAGGECSQDTLSALRTGRGVQMCIGSSLGRLAYSAADALNRVFAGAQPAPSGLGWSLVTKDDNLPAEGALFESSTDYRAGYRAVWGASAS
ncbi:substrate-binding domain-containing protein [Streptomyces sp. NPDC006872]|uniref:substrate-binding domain-containing protein n=1 Tax=Streptomyces sp. NPDC006872 TaxID=3155720 RepID=UPI0033C03ECF